MFFSENSHILQVIVFQQSQVNHKYHLSQHHIFSTIYFAFHSCTKTSPDTSYSVSGLAILILILLFFLNLFTLLLQILQGFSVYLHPDLLLH